jgi:hypothetical protein
MMFFSRGWPGTKKYRKLPWPKAKILKIMLVISMALWLSVPINCVLHTVVL